MFPDHARTRDILGESGVATAGERSLHRGSQTRLAQGNKPQLPKEKIEPLTSSAIIYILIGTE
jgi:hypothetical protein